MTWCESSNLVYKAYWSTQHACHLAGVILKHKNTCGWGTDQSEWVMATSNLAENQRSALDTWWKTGNHSIKVDGGLLYLVYACVVMWILGLSHDSCEYPQIEDNILKQV